MINHSREHPRRVRLPSSLPFIIIKKKRKVNRTRSLASTSSTTNGPHVRLASPLTRPDLYFREHCVVSTSTFIVRANVLLTRCCCSLSKSWKRERALKVTRARYTTLPLSWRLSAIEDHLPLRVNRTRGTKMTLTNGDDKIEFLVRIWTRVLLSYVHPFDLTNNKSLLSSERQYDLILDWTVAPSRGRSNTIFIY